MPKNTRPNVWMQPNPAIYSPVPIPPRVPPGLAPKQLSSIQEESSDFEPSSPSPDWSHEGKEWAIVPQRVVWLGDTSDISKDVLFKSIGKRNKGIPGVGMIDCISGISIATPHSVLPSVARKGDYINFRILWPGYEHAMWMKQIQVRIDDRPITRAGLASIIAKEFEEFIKSWQTALIRAETYFWRIGSRSFELKHMRLIRLINTDSNNWIAEVAVVMDKPADVLTSQVEPPPIFGYWQ